MSNLQAEENIDARLGETDHPQVSTDEEAMPGNRSGLSRTPLVVAGLTAILAVPLLVALGVLYQPRWLPLSDVAQLEMRVRDVAGGHPPQVGLAGRFLAYDEIGSHPGALVFYLLWPLYWLVGADGWGLLVATAALVLGGCAVGTWIGYRRGGWQLALLVAGVLALLLRAHGAGIVLEAWTPYLVIVWWVVFLLAVWSVLCRDVPMLPIAVFAGALAMQTHVSYVGLVGGIAALVVAGGVGVEARSRRHPGRQQGPGRGTSRGSWGRWVAASAGLGLVLWLPSLIEQATNDPGNLTVLLESFRNPEDERVAFSVATESWMAHLNALELLTGNLNPAVIFTHGLTLGSAVPGLLFLAVWAATAVMAWRRRHSRGIDLLRLHVVVGLGAVLGLVATAGIYGGLFAYLVLFGWGTTALMLLAVVWSVVSWLPSPRRGPAMAVAGAGSLVVVVLFAFDARDTEFGNATLSRKLAHMAAATLDRLDEDPAGCGTSCSYLVTWSDPHYVGSEGFGLLVELERRGIDARAARALEPAVRGHRVIIQDEADAIIHVAVTEDVIDEARSRAGAEELAYADPYTPAERFRHEELRQELVAALVAEGFDELLDLAADGHNAHVPTHDSMSDELLDLIEEANAIYRPSAVFLITS